MINIISASQARHNIKTSNKAIKSSPYFTKALNIINNAIIEHSTNGDTECSVEIETPDYPLADAFKKCIIEELSNLGYKCVSRKKVSPEIDGVYLVLDIFW